MQELRLYRNESNCETDSDIYVSAFTPYAPICMPGNAIVGDGRIFTSFSRSCTPDGETRIDRYTDRNCSSLNETQVDYPFPPTKITDGCTPIEPVPGNPPSELHQWSDCTSLPLYHCKDMSEIEFFSSMIADTSIDSSDDGSGSRFLVTAVLVIGASVLLSPL